MDAGAIGSLVVSYPLQLWDARDKRVLETVNFLLEKYFLDSSFYHEISHSGINAYLTLHVAQVLLRAGDSRFFNMVKSVAKLASPTGQWPEAIHPKTRGGCMGDGQHLWAAAEWVFMIRNMFVREEEKEGLLILCSGIPETWLKKHETLAFGPALTIFGKVSILMKVEDGSVVISWETQWYKDKEPPRMEIHLPGHPVRMIKDNQNYVKVKLNHVPSKEKEDTSDKHFASKGERA
jgi:hypothetical protein